MLCCRTYNNYNFGLCSMRVDETLHVPPDSLPLEFSYAPNIVPPSGNSRWGFDYSQSSAPPLAAQLGHMHGRVSSRIFCLGGKIVCKDQLCVKHAKFLSPFLSMNHQCTKKHKARVFITRYFPPAPPSR